MYSQIEADRQAGNFRAALQRCEDGLRKWGRQPGSEWYWKFRLEQAEVLLLLRRGREVLPLLDAGTPKPPSDSILRIRLLMDRGYAYFQIEQRPRALELLEQARRLAEASRATKLLGYVQMRLGDLSDNFRESEIYYRSARDIGLKLKSPGLLAGALVDLGYNRLRSWRYDEAVPYLQQGATIADRNGIRLVYERALGNLGWCYYKLGNWDQALAANREAESLAGALGDNDYRHRWLNTIGLIYYQLHDFDQAIQWQQRAAALARETGNEKWEGMEVSNVAQTYLDKGDFAGAENYNNQAIAIASRVGDRSTLIYCDLYRASIQAGRNEFAQARDTFVRALAEAQQFAEPNVLWQAHAGLASVYRAIGRWPQAERQYRDAIRTIDETWSKIGKDNSKVTFLARLIQFYQDYVDYLLDRGRLKKALDVCESARARVLSEKLEDRDAAPLRFELPKLIAMSRATRTVILSYWVAPGRSSLWVISPRGLDQFNLPGASELNALVTRYTGLVQQGGDLLTRNDTVIRRLTEVLLAPAQKLISPGANVIIIPDGRLYELNFETLVVRDPRPHYWVEDVNLVVAPSLSVLQNDTGGHKRLPKLLFIGDPEPADPQFPHLPHLQQEIGAVTKDFVQPTLVTGAAANPDCYREAGPGRFTIIHFAAHATANRESPLNSAIILSRRNDSYKLYARDVLDLPLRAELVTVSACRSAGSKAYAGEGLMGFSWAFLEAGARNVIAGLWDVDDAASVQLMSRLYRELATGSSPARALRTAKLELLHSEGSHRLPYFWGPFEDFTRFLQYSPASTVASRRSILPGETEASSPVRRPWNPSRTY